MFGMDAGTAADVALWLLLAAGFVLITVGCHATRPAPKVIVEETFPAELDRAA